MAPLPIDNVLPELRAAFESHRSVVLSADPGAGKTTRLPLALLGEPWLLEKRIVMLEPRRLAAQRAAAYMAQQFGERAGETIGYRIRGDSKVGKKTRIEIVTEGILTRMLQDDAALTGVGLVIFDEFHERSIHADLGLALTLDVQENLRNDLRILVMSATLDGLAVATLLGDASVIKSGGRMFPVTTRYLDRPIDGPVERAVAANVLRALREEPGDVLVFLPGQREIRRVESLLGKEMESLHVERSAKGGETNVAVHALFGDAPPEKQQAALALGPRGTRKVILSTSIAETSITIDGVRVVIDSGLSRSARFDPRRGMSGLVTGPVSKSSADQRRGRAGRQQSGACYRMWTDSQHAQLPPFAQPEIVVADLAPLALEMARWGDPKGEKLKFLDLPPGAHLSQAHDLLYRLGVLDDHDSLTDHGKAMSELPVHPRLAHMLIRGRQIGLGALACDVAALLEERDLLRGGHDNDIDLFSRWHVLQEGSGGDRLARERAQTQAARLRQLLNVKQERMPEDRLGVLLALVYPERVAKRRGARGERYQLANGTGAALPRGSLLAREQYLAIGDVDGVGSEVRIFLASPLSEEDVKEMFAHHLISTDEVRWDIREEMVVSRRVTRFGAIELSEASLAPVNEMMRQAMVEGIRELGLDALPWSKEALSVRARSEWLRMKGLVGTDWPDLSDEHLNETLERWLLPYLGGIVRRAHLEKLDMAKIIRAQFTYQQVRDLDRLAPTHLTVPTGSRIPLDYSMVEQPVLAVRLQEMFGETETPTVGGGKVKVLLHLLSPSHRPLAVTQDLPSFWKNAYIQVRKDMRGQYPKHEWPEDPMKARPTKRSKRRNI
jgi:ATP-dependent helicase HrpB